MNIDRDHFLPSHKGEQTMTEKTLWGEKKSSRLPGFHSLPLGERANATKLFANLNPEELKSIHSFGTLTKELTDTFIENSVGTFELPLGIATNFLINQKEVLIPMAVEESSVIAAASHGAKFTRAGGGFYCESTDPIMTGQLQLKLDHIKPETMVNLEEILLASRQDLIEIANRGLERLKERGGGVRDIDWRMIPELNQLILHLSVDTRDAMGANIVNTVCEKLAKVISRFIPGAEIGLRILTNLTIHRRATAKCIIPARAFDRPEYCGRDVIKGIRDAWLFAKHDIFRATTNNKGIMNGIDPVVIATGNDWRAIEAGCHAWASRTGSYQPLAEWSIDHAENLIGVLEVPMAVGTVGGVTRLHPTARAALKILGLPSAQELSEIIVAVGLAQNLSALRALASEGIQKGHMSLHKKNLDLLRLRH